MQNSLTIYLHLSLGNAPFVIPCKSYELSLYALSDIRQEATEKATQYPDREVHWSLDRGVYIV